MNHKERARVALLQAKWQTFSRAMGLIVKPVDQEGQ